MNGLPIAVEALLTNPVEHYAAFVVYAPIGYDCETLAVGLALERAGLGVDEYELTIMDLMPDDRPDGCHALMLVIRRSPFSGPPDIVDRIDVALEECCATS